MRLITAVIALVFTLYMPVSLAEELTIEITQGVDNPTPIAVVPFAWQGGAVNEDIAAIVEADLHRVGQFRPLARSSMLGLPHEQKEVFFRDWRALGIEYLIIGKAGMVGGDKPLQVQYELYDVLKQERLLFERAQGSIAQLRDLAHLASDKIYQKLTGVRGAFSTKILYVSAKNLGNGKFSYRLIKADADGARSRLILESDEPILSPAWSPNRQEIAYVSFENGYPGIYRQHLASGRRERLTNFPGLNSAPAWSPDGKHMAMTLSKDGNPEIYVMELATKKLTRLTNKFSIDTEASWMPDGKSLVFTSNRGGKPQIYQVTLASGQVQRLTFDGDYNARATPLPDGRGLIMVHRKAGQFHIAVQDFNRGTIDVLTQTSLDESPSIAPNASMVMYATQHQGRGILAAVSIDGRVRFHLPSEFRDVREPSWSPF